MTMILTPTACTLAQRLAEAPWRMHTPEPIPPTPGPPPPEMPPQPMPEPGMPPITDPVPPEVGEPIRDPGAPPPQVSGAVMH